MGRILDVLLRQLDFDSASRLTEDDLIGEPESETIMGTSSTIVSANGGRLVFVGNMSPMSAFLAINKTALMDKGILLPGNTSQVITLPDGMFLSAVSGGGNISLVWQFFAQGS